jgi:hypothetical protein
MYASAVAKSSLMILINARPALVLFNSSQMGNLNSAGVIVGAWGGQGYSGFGPLSAKAGANSCRLSAIDVIFRMVFVQFSLCP